MRLHHLRLTAFGPFPGEVEVDLDRLGDAGLFLLSGPTGAGKTSVLDAICFALYGDVPGVRSGARRLRSDQADPAVATEVRLEATLRGRRFRFIRSPAWDRPKKRGDGTTTAPARVGVSELVGTTWDPLTSRADEAGDLVGRLLGLTLTQFTQVALLPQGRFATFLRARSEERHALLQQLFHTGRFEQVERWLRERRLSLGRDDARHHEVVAGVVNRVSEAAGTVLPDTWDPHDLAVPARDGELLSWSRTCRSQASHALGRASAGAVTATEEERAHRAELDRVRAAQERRDRLRRARAEQARLAGDAAEHADGVRRLDAARRALPVLPLHREQVEAETAAQVADRADQDAGAGLAAVLGAVVGAVVGAVLGAQDPVDLDTTARRTAHDLAVARAALPRAAQLHRLATERATVRDAAAQVTAEREAVERRAPVAEDRLDAARVAETAAREAAALVPTSRAEAEALQASVHARAEVEALRVQVEAARSAWLDARSATLDLRDTLAALQQARIEGMAAELAVALAVGASCPVCGSHDHPAKAGGAPGAPDAAAEREARTAVDDAASTELAHDDVVRGLQARLATLEARAGDAPVEELERRLHAARAAVADLTARARRHPALVAVREAAEREQAHLAQRRRELAVREATLAGEVHSAGERVDELRAELARLLDGTGHPTLEAWIDHLDLVAARCSTATTTRERLRTARATARAALGRLEQAVAEAGFDSPGEAVAAGLDPAELATLADRVSAHERRTTEVAVVLRELGADEADGGEDPGPGDPAHLATAQTRHAAALDALGTARAVVETQQTRVGRLTDLLAALDQACAAWEPVRADLARTGALAAFCEGKSADNELRMRLSAYVLAYRLTQVVEAANERLTSMSDQRYRLEHTVERGVGETRGGLSLVVRDDWSGQARDPATLSGGETFVVSLALALGLADVIAHESGGATLETLFVDEGFGSLDADTLDDVMDVLDALRDGGRVVGVVSHVAEMRDRIPTQLVVGKARSGSTLEVVG